MISSFCGAFAVRTLNPSFAGAFALLSRVAFLLSRKQVSLTFLQNPYLEVFDAVQFRKPPCSDEIHET